MGIVDRSDGVKAPSGPSKVMLPLLFTQAEESCRPLKLRVNGRVICGLEPSSLAATAVASQVRPIGPPEPVVTADCAVAAEDAALTSPVSATSSTHASNVGP